MILIKIIGLAFVAIVAFNVLKAAKPEFSLFVLICAGAAILILLSDKIAEAVAVFSGIAEKSGIGSTVFSSVLRIIGIGYITEYTASVCEDNNCSSLGKKVELAGKLTIFVMAIPVISGVIDIIGGLI